jgi:succinate dehydrogenase / fumarate reductase, cytochrome b subunit
MADQPHRPAMRPLSPFLTVFRWPITMATSIVHRMTGVGLAGGTVLVAWWLVAAASGPESFDFFNVIVGSTLGQLVLFGFVWSLAFHLVNGVRHLAWDLGYGFSVPTANLTGIIVFALSLAIAVGFFALAYLGLGGYYQ